MPKQRSLLTLLSLYSLVLLLGLSPALAQKKSPPVVAEAAREPLTLEQAIAKALTLNPRVRQALETLHAAQDGVAQARAARSPTAQVTITGTRVSTVPEFTIPTPTGTETVSLGQAYNTTGVVTVAQPLYAGGKITAGIRATRAGEVESSQGLLRTYQTVVSDVKQAYYAVRVAADLVQVAEQTLASAQEHLRVSQVRYDTGVAPRFDVLQAQARVAQAEQAVIQARNGINLARAALDNAMGVPQDQQFELTTPYANPPAPVADLPALISQAEQARPEIRQTQAQVDAAGAVADIARADKRPSLGLAWVYTRPLNTNVVQLNQWTLALTGSLTVFNGKQTTAAVRRAHHQQETVRGLLEQLRQSIALQVRSAYLNLNSATERIVAAKKGVDQAEEAYRVATVRYEAGVGISVEIIDAEVALASARNDYARATYDYNLALAQLEYAVGSWQPSAERVPVPPAATTGAPAQ